MVSKTASRDLASPRACGRRRIAVEPGPFGSAGEQAGAQPVEVAERDHVNELRVARGSGKQLIGRERRNVVARVRELPVALGKSVDREHDAIAVAGERALIDATTRSGSALKPSERNVFTNHALWLAPARMRWRKIGTGAGPLRNAPPSQRPKSRTATSPIPCALSGGPPARPACHWTAAREIRCLSRKPSPIAAAAGEAGALIRRRRGGIADRAGENVVPAIGRLDHNGVRLRG